MTARPRSGRWKWTLAVVLLAVVAGGAWWWQQRRERETPRYQTAPVTRGTLTQRVTATGQLNPVINVQVGSQISGTIAKLFADWNSPVKKDQLLAQIDPATYQASVHQSEGDLANAQAGLELAQLTARRSAALIADKLQSQEDHDKALVGLHQAEAQVQIRQAVLERAQVDLARCAIYSPVDGVVISRNIDVGQTVAASLSAPTLFVIANNLAQMQIDANVAEADVGNIETNQQVEFTVDAFPNRTFRGLVLQVRNAPITVQNVVSYDTVIGVDNAELKLKPGMTANVGIIVAQREHALKIPNAALRFRPPDPGTNTVAGAAAGGTRARAGAGGPPGGTGRPRGERPPRRTVYLLADGRLQPVQVTTGISDGIDTEVLDGLSETNQVVTSASSRTSTSASPAITNPFGGGGPPRRF